MKKKAPAIYSNAYPDWARDRDRVGVWRHRILERRRPWTHDLAHYNGPHEDDQWWPTHAEALADAREHALKAVNP